MTALSDDEDPPPHKRFDPRAPTLPPEGHFAGPDEVTATDLKSPLPQRPTQPVTLGDVWALLGRIEGKVDDLAGKVKAVDHGLMGLTNATTEELSILRADMRQGFEGVKLWLFGEDADHRTIRTGIAHHIAAASELGKSALDRAAAANDIAQRALDVAHEALQQAQQHGSNGAGE